MAAGSSDGRMLSGMSSMVLSVPQKSAPVAGRRRPPCRAGWRACWRFAALRRRGVLMIPALSCDHRFQVVGEDCIRLDAERGAQLPAVEVGERARLRQHQIGDAPLAGDDLFDTL